MMTQFVSKISWLLRKRDLRDLPIDPVELVHTFRHYK